MSGAASTGYVIQLELDLNRYKFLQMENGTKLENNTQKLSKQQSYYDKWLKAVDDAEDPDKKCQVGNRVWKDKDKVLSRAEAEAYACAKISDYDEAYSLELQELQDDLDSDKTLYEALITLEQAEYDAAKQNAATELQNTHLLQS